MYGLAAIQQANGWAMAGAGACIVIAGLAVLSFLISRIPLLIGLFEEKVHPQTETIEDDPAPHVIVPDKLPDDVQAAATIFIALTAELGEIFTLVDLHHKSRAIGLPHPHLSINRFRESGILISVGEGQFSWQAPADE
jgi:hypothetical protein